MSKKKSGKQSKPWYKKWWGILLLIVFGFPIAITTLVTIIALIIGITNVASNPSSLDTAIEQQESSNQPAVNYIEPDRDILSAEIVGTKYIVVTGYITNQTKKVGDADCIVEFYDHEMNWAGGKGLGGRTLEPGERYDFTVQVEVEHTGLVAKQGIYCGQE